jgi:putative Holliday junction resolvase
LDLGARRIGVAITDGSQTVAVGVETLERSGDVVHDHAAVASLVAEYEAVGVVVGLPLALSGRDGPAARAARQEATELQDRVGVEVELVDERLTTVAAAGALHTAGRTSRQQRSVIDRTAAAVLLQSWIDRQVKTSGVTD